MQGTVGVGRKDQGQITEDLVDYDKNFDSLVSKCKASKSFL